LGSGKWRCPTSSPQLSLKKTGSNHKTFTSGSLSIPKPPIARSSEGGGGAGEEDRFSVVDRRGGTNDPLKIQVGKGWKQEGRVEIYHTGKRGGKWHTKQRGGRIPSNKFFDGDTCIVKGESLDQGRKKKKKFPSIMGVRGI